MLAPAAPLALHKCWGRPSGLKATLAQSMPSRAAPKSHLPSPANPFTPPSAPSLHALPRHSLPCSRIPPLHALSPSALHYAFPHLPTPTPHAPNHYSTPYSRSRHPTPPQSSNDSISKVADELLNQVQAKARRATQAYPLVTTLLVLFSVANFLTQHQLLSRLVHASDLNSLLNTLVPVAFSTQAPREFASISLAEVTTRTWLPGTWLALIASFTHVSVFHLWVATSLVKDIGEALEPQVGLLRLLGIYIAGAAVSCWASTTLSGSALIGASGAASGLLGALLLEVLFRSGSVGPEAKSKLVGSAIWLLVLGMTLRVADPRVYVWGIGAGAVASVALGVLPVFARPLLTIMTMVSTFGMLAIMLVALLRKVHVL